jgi:hypothetical protein
MPFFAHDCKSQVSIKLADHESWHVGVSFPLIDRALNMLFSWVEQVERERQYAKRAESFSSDQLLVQFGMWQLPFWFYVSGSSDSNTFSAGVSVDEFYEKLGRLYFMLFPYQDSGSPSDSESCSSSSCYQNIGPSRCNDDNNCEVPCSDSSECDFSNYGVLGGFCSPSGSCVVYCNYDSDCEQATYFYGNPHFCSSYSSTCVSYQPTAPPPPSNAEVGMSLSASIQQSIISMLPPSSCSLDSLLGSDRKCDFETDYISKLLFDSSVLKASIRGCTGKGSRYNLPAVGVSLSTAGNRVLPTAFNLLKTLNLCATDSHCKSRLGSKWVCDKGDKMLLNGMSLPFVLGYYWKYLSEGKM